MFPLISNSILPRKIFTFKELIVINEKQSKVGGPVAYLGFQKGVKYSLGTPKGGANWVFKIVPMVKTKFFPRGMAQ